jgi:hypothetical protein
MAAKAPSPHATLPSLLSSAVGFLQLLNEPRRISVESASHLVRFNTAFLRQTIVAQSMVRMCALERICVTVCVGGRCILAAYQSGAHAAVL